MTSPTVPGDPLRLCCRAVGRAAGAVLLAWTTAMGAQTIATPSLAAQEIAAVRATKPPVIDGVVAEDEWEGATAVTGFIQYEPRRGELSDARTEALVLYDAGHLYVAFRVGDAEPITA